MTQRLVKKIKLIREMRKSLTYLQYKGNYKQAEILEKSIEILKLSSKLYDPVSTKEKR